MDDFVDFINEKVGTARNADGTLKETAGRVDAIDEIIKSVATFDDALVSAIKNSLETLADEALKYGKDYLSIAEKIVAKGGLTYVEKEIKRLSGIIRSANVKPAAKTTFQVKQNILKAFLI